ncbi:MAG TPA: hypothetical protein PLZ08_04705 [Bacillota bacterium]|jgi:Na+/proline symporter|nr:hypothetical protein [Bacillota bacterium]HOL09597.1 hypothetical protein [Bacillota bacterium]HPO97242.1 hypothetical protein [Bacillota bacterium]
MGNYAAMLLVLLVATYTVLFGIEHLKTKNYLAFFALLFLALSIIVLPFYMLFIRT